MRLPGSPRRWAVLVILAVLVVGCVRLADRAMPIDYYRVVDDRTIAVGTLTGPATWTRVTGVEETETAVTVYVSEIQAPLPGSAVGVPLELQIRLERALGARRVIDGSSGSPIPRTSCKPPDPVYPGCPGFGS